MTHETSLHDSVWAHTATPLAYPLLEGEIRTQVAVIGGGYTGCVAALNFYRPTFAK